MYLLKKFREEYIRDISALGSLPLYGLFCLYALASLQYELFFRLLFMVVAIMLVTYLIKSFHFKPRPDNKAKKKGKSQMENTDLSSFPSVHAARITALGVLFSMLFNNYLITILAAIVIIAVCASRILIRRHYPIDVAAGFILGLLVGYAAFIFV